MYKYVIKCVDFGWTETVRTGKMHGIGDLLIYRGCICVVIKEAEK